MEILKPEPEPEAEPQPATAPVESEPLLQPGLLQPATASDAEGTSSLPLLEPEPAERAAAAAAAATAEGTFVATIRGRQHSFVAVRDEPADEPDSHDLDSPCVVIIAADDSEGDLIS